MESKFSIFKENCGREEKKKQTTLQSFSGEKKVFSESTNLLTVPQKSLDACSFIPSNTSKENPAKRQKTEPSLPKSNNPTKDLSDLVAEATEEVNQEVHEEEDGDLLDDLITSYLDDQNNNEEILRILHSEQSKEGVTNEDKECKNDVSTRTSYGLSDEVTLRLDALPWESLEEKMPIDKQEIIEILQAWQNNVRT